MSDDISKGSPFPLSGILIFLAALGVSIFTQAPFKSPRPVVPEIREPYEKVNARLWQDPFRAILDHARSVGGARDGRDFASHSGVFGLYSEQYDRSPGPDDLPDWLKSLPANKHKRVDVLAVMVQGAPYAEETERRIRDRYAILSGLRQAGYVPMDAEHIEYLKIDPCPKDRATNTCAKSTAPVALTNIIPFEYLRHLPQPGSKDRNRDSLILLWINEAVFQKDPLSKLSRLAEYLTWVRNESGSQPRLTIIGPARSGTLRSMLKETVPPHRFAGFSSYSSVALYSAMATVPEKRILHSVQAGLSSATIKRQFGACGINFHNVIHSDDILAKALISELKNRGVSNENHIVLVAEWDTFYGRKLGEIFENAGAKGNIHLYSYLRGIDGMLPGEQESARDDKEGQKNNPADNIKRLEQPTGKSQYDYLRRMTEQLEVIRQKNPIKAVGVLGSDFYDKFLVLQAFRQKYPELIYFTTDLDARLYHPAYIPWTRNLIVASTYGLSLDDHLHAEVPPFRDSYQTSLYYATFSAFKPDRNQTAVAPPRTTPLLFEIGRNSPVLLNDTGKEKHESTRPLLFGAMIFLLVIALLWFSSQKVKELLKTIVGKHPGGTALGLSIITLAVIWFNTAILHNPAEEPFSLFEGISIWPTELLRLLAGILAAAFFLVTQQSLKDNSQKITREFRFRAGAEPENKSSLSVRIKQAWHSARYDWSARPGSMDSLWHDYLQQDVQSYRLMRLLPMFMIYFALCLGIMSLAAPANPVRGAMSMALNYLILAISVLSALFLIFYIFDITRLCTRFIAQASESLPKWSEESLRHFSLDKDDAREVAIKEWLLVHLIAARTGAVGNLIFYPFIVWFLLFISRNNYFDNWQTPVALAVVISLSALYAWSCAFSLRNTAERARSDAVHRLKEETVKILASEPVSQEKLRRIEFVLKEITSLKEGAFAPFSQHPLVQTLLIPFGGVGGVFMMDFFSKMNL